jgi:pimeloyl-ACP methyl ester carboxylesterase
LIDRYDWAGGSEAMLRFGPADGPVVVVAPPLFEEANRMRGFLVSVLRRLADRGIASVLPDLPGQGESLLPTEAAQLADWGAAFSACVETVGRDAAVIAIRGGALVASESKARRRYHFEPESGASLVRDLLRARRAALLAAGERVVADDPSAPGPSLLLAGHLLSRELLRSLMTAVPGAADRTTVVFPAPSSPYPKLPGRKFWWANEPGTDEKLADALAQDAGDWVLSCAA